MKSKLFLVFLFLNTLCVFGQISFEKGYFIDNDNRKTECLIRNEDWKNNPTEFMYKPEGTDLPEKVTITSVREFGIYNFSIYIRAKVRIDRTSDDINKLTADSVPVWSEEVLLLKVLFSGKASLYYYHDDNSERFFYSTSDTSITQLIYRKYLDSNKHVIISNRFRQQLWLDIKCSTTSLNSVENLNYNRKDLEKYFASYSECGNNNPKNSVTKSSRDWFNLKIAPGINLSSLRLNNNLNYNREWNYTNNVSFRLGIEAEFVLPFKKNKWAVTCEPTFQCYTDEYNSGTGTSSVNYRSIDFPAGLRYYFFLNPDLKMFVNGSFIANYSLNFNSHIIISMDNQNETTLAISTGPSFAVGGGFEYRRVSAEIRYYSNRDLVKNYKSWNNNYSRVSVVFGYKIVKKGHSTDNRK